MATWIVNNGTGEIKITGVVSSKLTDGILLELFDAAGEVVGTFRHAVSAYRSEDATPAPDTLPAQGL